MMDYCGFYNHFVILILFTNCKIYAQYLLIIIIIVIWKIMEIIWGIQANVGPRQYPENINVLHAIRRLSRMVETAHSPILLLDRKEACRRKATGQELEVLKKLSHKCERYFCICRFIFWVLIWLTMMHIILHR